MIQAALLNHLWQSTIFAAAAAGLALGLRRHQARVRFWVWMAASLKFLVPFSALAAVGALLRRPEAHAAAAPATLVSLSQPFQTWVVAASSTARSTAGAQHFYWGWALAAIWALGAASLAVRWAARWRRLAQLARTASPAYMEGTPVLVTEAAIEPGVFGILRPVLLFPAGLRQRLSPAELEAVVEHERCHLRRRDNLWSALHLVAETVFWFHPLVWWIGARLVEERERACDEAVLQHLRHRGGDRAAYAGGIVQVCRYYMESPLSCVAGIGGGRLKQRVAAILEGGWGRSLSRGRKLMLAGLGLVALMGPLAAGIVFGQAAQQTAPLPTEFDAATIKASAPPGAGPNRMIFRGTHVDPGRFTATNMSLKDLIEQAYGLKPYQVVGPDWMDSERFDVSAETSAAVPRDKMAALLQPFLAQQFKLKIHRESKVMETYTLIVTDKSKLKPASSAGVEPVLPDAPPDGRGANETKMLRGRGPMPPGSFMMGFSPQGMMLMGNSSLQQLTDMLARQVDRPVVNGTNLEGNYAIHLSYAPPPGVFGGLGGPKEGMMINGRPPEAGAKPDENATAAAPAVSLFTALQQQLGLKLDPGKAPVELLVVDHAEKAPVGN
ncbi:MAG: TIGR03435 family protein [Terriglobales bacterium]